MGKHTVDSVETSVTPSQPPQRSPFNHHNVMTMNPPAQQYNGKDMPKSPKVSDDEFSGSFLCS